jgi:hypothetical protein
MHLLYGSLRIVMVIVLMKEHMDLLHTWWLLRLLFVFLLACPFLIVPVLLGFFRKHPDAEDRTQAAAGQGGQGTRVEISGHGTWKAHAEDRSASPQPNGRLSPIERRAA